MQGTRSRTRTRTVDGAPGTRIAWPATLAAKRHTPLRADHLRFVREASRSGELHCFALDCSASMLAGAQLALAKGLLVALFNRAARERAEAALICFGGTRADLRFGPAVPRWWNERWLKPIGGAGGTPLALGVRRAAHLLERAARRKPAQQRWLWVLSDGRSRDWPVRPAAADRIVFVDFEHAGVKLGRCAQLAHAWGALHRVPEDLIER
ncbi:vWA domain-containing protein [Paraburkholderia megapolitana]|uniref:Magnesium chelatase subunit ChlD-like protein n=1 Tax=Paraburkholderia megapolitana TaxID=420953 RepID=A0A1I3D0N9_9BURK|nr:magnesium chelatase [Paraburkholderia megapolitana]QDQ81617.1 magnesium chelatase [Paraburkholderia megapolitana]SFH80089.1 magnesium chelatase subunit ChlD-like protein [Paraburkholderia megapolitana]